jgi:hypothetical protein
MIGLNPPAEDDLSRFRYLVDISFDNMCRFILVLTQHPSELHNLTGGKMVATNHRVITLKIDVDGLVISYVMLRIA